MTEITGLGLPSPSSDDQPDCPRAFGRKLQTAGCDHWQAHQLGNDSRQPTEPQRFLEGFENVFLSDRFNIDDAIRVKADLSQCRGKEVGTGQAPNDLAFGSRRDTGNKKRRCGRIYRPCSTSGKLVHCSIGQPAARKVFVDLDHPKWQDGLRSRNRPFEMMDAISKIGDDWVRAAVRHSEPSSKQVFISFKSEYVRYLFLIAI
ncbi:hypothetical protein HER20_31025 [Rhizobium sp. BUS002]|uniref:Uncharacterized protein n=1 Tax=Rhizobium phaseoli TaxID=396 RepID=A0A7X6J2E6_9HYPH|nr:hypothetical protein [Rhizobium phaseoli]QPK09184.1 hypothetical protein HER27_000955 [Rhizobium phaseoli]